MEANREYWRAISVFTNYEVSSVGRVRNSKTGRILRPSNNGKGYLQVVLSKNGKCNTFEVHRLVAEQFSDNPSNKRCVDHIDNDTLNNNHENLRWATHAENGGNRRKQSGSSSIYKGVSYNKQLSKWQAYIKLPEKQLHLGTFTDEREAAEAYNAAAAEHFGEFAKLNELD